MTRVRLSGPAQRDLTALLATSEERWGEDGRVRYAKVLASALRAIAARPTGPKTTARDDLLPGLRSFHSWHARGRHGVKAPVHIVYYRTLESEIIEVVRVLHERMDPLRHLEVRPPRPSTKSRRTRK